MSAGSGPCASSAIRRLSIALLTATALGGCSAVANTKVAEQAVATFHERLDAAEFDAIYDQSADDLKKASTRQNFVAILEAVRRKLGTSKSSDQKGWNVNYNISSSFVTLSYATVYGGGEATEVFTYRMDGEMPLLAGYHINSTALLLN
jgi:hypothetical protein